MVVICQTITVGKKTPGLLGTLQKPFPISAKLKNSMLYRRLMPLHHENRRTFTRKAAGEKQAVQTPLRRASVFFLSKVAAHMLPIIPLPGGTFLLVTCEFVAACDFFLTGVLRKILTPLTVCLFTWK